MLYLNNERQGCSALPFNTSQGLVIFSIPSCHRLCQWKVCVLLMESWAIRNGMCDVMSGDLSGILQAISRGRDTEADLWLRALCQAEFGGLTKWIIWPLLCHLFSFFLFFIYVCWAIAKRTGVWAPARCIDPANQLHHTSFQVLAERIIIA